jgi:hypothetical protein
VDETTGISHEALLDRDSPESAARMTEFQLSPQKQVVEHSKGCV